jgi:hypothetical protein
MVLTLFWQLINLLQKPINPWTDEEQIEGGGAFVLGYFLLECF